MKQLPQQRYYQNRKHLSTVLKSRQLQATRVLISLAALLGAQKILIARMGCDACSQSRVLIRMVNSAQ